MKNDYSNEVLSARAGKNLRKLIRKQGHTQYSFAMEFGVDERTISRWIKNGVHDVDDINRAACILRVSFGDLVFADSGDEIPLFSSEKRKTPIFRSSFGQGMGVFLQTGQILSYRFFVGLYILVLFPEKDGFPTEKPVSRQNLSETTAEKGCMFCFTNGKPTTIANRRQKEKETL